MPARSDHSIDTLGIHIDRQRRIRPRVESRDSIRQYEHSDFDVALTATNPVFLISPFAAESTDLRQRIFHFACAAISAIFCVANPIARASIDAGNSNRATSFMASPPMRPPDPSGIQSSDEL
ncbi:hypothetical protein [Burkholderia latens]|uniref:hypothetical protein n=1 Tax=Burkholderia latens TaxID=488446 RepID=UPI00142DADB3|nr:hypothetical protein [Burkholderia latens]